MSATASADRAPRALVSLTVHMALPDRETFARLFSHNISRTGIFIRTKEPLPPGSQLRFTYTVSSERVLHGVGLVRWVRTEADAELPDRPPGMGVAFVDIDAASEELVTDIVARFGEGDRAPKASDAVPGAVAAAEPTQIVIDACGATAVLARRGKGGIEATENVVGKPVWPPHAFSWNREPWPSPHARAMARRLGWRLGDHEIETPLGRLGAAAATHALAQALPSFQKSSDRQIVCVVPAGTESVSGLPKVHTVASAVALAGNTGRALVIEVGALEARGARVEGGALAESWYLPGCGLADAKAQQGIDPASVTETLAQSCWEHRGDGVERAIVHVEGDAWSGLADGLHQALGCEVVLVTDPMARIEGAVRLHDIWR